MSAIFNDSKLNQTGKFEKIAELMNDLAVSVYRKWGATVEDPWKLRVEQV